MSPNNRLQIVSLNSKKKNDEILASLTNQNRYKTKKKLLVIERFSHKYVCRMLVVSTLFHKSGIVVHILILIWLTSRQTDLSRLEAIDRPPPSNS